jgi:hypothetical protein
MNKLTKKEFALQAIKPYYNDPSLCALSKDKKNCLNYTDDGKNCVFGKYLLDPKQFPPGESVDTILHDNNQKDILKPEAVNILSLDEWEYLQSIHDIIAGASSNDLEEMVENLELFTYEELCA